MIEHGLDYKKLDKKSKMVITALDHAAEFGSLEGLENPGKLYNQLIPTSDSLLVSYGSYKKWSSIINKTVGVLRCDGGWSPLQNTPFTNFNLYFDDVDALDLGAKGLICMAIFGDKTSEITLHNVVKLAKLSRKSGLFLIAEVLFSRDVSLTERCHAIRIATECGADIIKTEYPGSADAFSRMVEATYVPVVVLGGQKTKEPLELLRMVSNVMKAGGNGVAIGRNIWQREKPGAIAQAIYSIVHDNADPELIVTD